MPSSRTRRSGTVKPRIVTVRGTRVVLDDDLALLYGVSTGRLNQAVKRNQGRFPRDFTFRLTAAEQRILKSQSVISSGAHGGRRNLSRVFTEHGAIMAASVLNTRRAIDMSVLVVRAFLRLRDWASQRRALAARLDDLEQRVAGHDDKLGSIIAALRRLLEPPDRPRRAIGFSAASEVPGSRARAGRLAGAAPRPVRR